MDLRPHIERLITRASELENELARPEVASNPAKNARTGPGICSRK